MRYCVFNIETGLIRARFDTHSRDAHRQVGEGEDLYPGDADPLRHRITRVGDDYQVIECEQEDFGDGSVWDVEQGRRLSVAEQKFRADMVLKRRIAEIDLQQIRAVTELVADPSNTEARKHFDRRLAEISELRAKLENS